MWWDLWPWACRGKKEADDRSVGSDRYRAVGSYRGKGEAEDRWIGALKKVSLGLAVERKRQRIGLLGRFGLLGLAVERKKQMIDLLGRIGIGLLGLAVERERQRIGGSVL